MPLSFVAFVHSTKESSMSALLRSFVLTLWIGALSFGSCTTIQADTPTNEKIHFVLAGDSTVTEDSGWGIGFASLLSERAYCTNLAKGGRSSRSFRDEGWWQKCLDLKPNYLLIQFGHNDQPGKGPVRESAHDGAFREHLKRYVDEARAAGIQPILITSLTRRKWNRESKIEPTLAEYAHATTLVAKEKSVPLIDLHQASIQQCEQLGPTAFRAFEPMKVDGADHTHLNREGSLAVGPIVVDLLLKELPDVAYCFSADKVKASMVPQPYATKIQKDRLDLEETESMVTIRNNGKPMLVYNKQSPPVPSGIDPVYQRSGFLHPVHSPAGQVVTATFPADHAHQHGIFTAWVKTSWNERSIDFWNLAGGTGRVLHQRIISTFEEGDNIGFEVDLIHRAEESPVVDILRERWRVSAIPTDGTYHAFEIQTVQHAQTDIPLIVQEYHYGGMALRGPVAWLNPDKARPGQQERCSIVNDLGSDRVKGNHEPAKWVCMTGQSNGNPVTICALSHPSNFRAPQTTRLHPTKPYFVFSPCVKGDFVIDRKQPYSGRYKFLVTDSEPNPEWLNDQWNDWAKTKP
jgi:lysophospholipase L1-like esterase